ncbi:MAG: hypothetical protein KGI27_13540, partial [Thaumarchaeota archaeon]|nr:hypothetical protein [Nitrososphaerota archaeon]
TLMALQEDVNDFIEGKNIIDIVPLQTESDCDCDTCHIRDCYFCGCELCRKHARQKAEDDAVDREIERRQLMREAYD